MSDGSLSQEEIDALLQGSEDVDNISGSAGLDSGNDLMSQAESNSFIELLSSSSGNVGGSLAAMIGRTVTLSNPRLEIVSLSDLQNQLPQEIVEIKMDFEQGTSGEHSFVLDTDTAKVVAGLMMGQEGGDLTEASMSAISEAMNIISGSEINTIGTQIKKELRCAPPVINKLNRNGIMFSPSDSFAKVLYDFTIEGSQVNQLIELYTLNIVKDLTSGMIPASNEPAGTGAKNKGAQMPQGQQG
jgi:flagellar motor switch protein FliN/FliY